MWVNKLRSSAVAIAILLVSLLAPVTTQSWDVLDRAKSDTLYFTYDVTYRVEISGAGGSGVAVASYTLHVVLEKLNRTHYLASMIADNITYYFTSNDVVFLHILASTYLANLSKYFIDFLYVPTVEGVTVRAIVSKAAVARFLNSVARWFNYIENTTGETCGEIRLNSITVSSGVRYRLVSPRTELIYDCPTGLLVSLRSVIEGGSAEMTTRAIMSVELSKLNFLDLTSVKVVSQAEVPQGLPMVLLIASTISITIVAVVMALLTLRKLRLLRGTRS